MKKWFRIACWIPIICLALLTAFRYVPVEYTTTLDEEGYFILHWTNWVYQYHLNEIITLILTVASSILCITALLNEGAEQPPKIEMEGVTDLEEKAVQAT